jgi:Leucine-rich repeat (LRR) protein
MSRAFQVADNQLTSLPAEIGQLTKLESLSRAKFELSGS